MKLPDNILPNSNTLQPALSLVILLAIIGFIPQANARTEEDAIAAQVTLLTDESFTSDFADTPNQGSASIGSTAKASYNLPEGKLRASINLGQSYNGSAASASASLHDTLTFNFSDSFPQLIEWQFHLTGSYDTFAAQAIGDALIFQFSLSVDSGNSSPTLETVTANYDEPGVAQTYDQIFSGNFLLNSGDQIEFVMALELDTFQGIVDFSNTAALQLTLPAGVTYTSEQGLLTAVPVPPAILLMLSGLLSIGTFRSFK